MVADLHAPRDGSALNIDVIRCRYSGFVEANEHDLPIFAPTDEIQPAREGELGDFMWVSLGAVRSLRRALPYWGPGWYGRATCEFFLDAGIARWSDFKLSFSASAHRPATYLRARLKVFDYLCRQTARSEAARELIQGDKADLGEFFAKLCCNMLFGTWAVREQWRCKLETTSHPDDITFDGLCSTTLTPGGGGVFRDVLMRQKVLSMTS